MQSRLDSAIDNDKFDRYKAKLKEVSIQESLKRAKLREFKLDGVINADDNLDRICCTSLANARREYKSCITPDGKLVRGAPVPHADIVQLLDEAGYLYRGEDICMHNGNDEQAKAFCGDCAGYLMNFIKNAAKGHVPPMGITAKHKIEFNNLIRDFARASGGLLKTNEPERTKIYLMEIGSYWESLSLLEAVNISDISNPENLECLLYGTIRTEDKNTILLFQIEKNNKNRYNVKSLVLRGGKEYNIPTGESSDCINPFTKVSNVLDGLICADLPQERATV